jgi:hypothetical protein
MQRQTAAPTRCLITKYLAQILSDRTTGVQDFGGAFSMCWTNLLAGDWGHAVAHRLTKACGHWFGFESIRRFWLGRVARDQCLGSAEVPG